MTFPTPYTVQRLPFTAGGTDAHGNPVDGWGAPVDVAVHGWAPPSADTEPERANRDLVESDLDLYAPAGTVSRPHDRWVVDGETFEAVGHVQDFTKGPWQWAAGVRIKLNRVEG